MPLALLCQTLVLSPGGSGTPSGPKRPGARTLGSPGASPRQGTRAAPLLAETPSTAFCIGSGGRLGAYRDRSADIRVFLTSDAGADGMAAILEA